MRDINAYLIKMESNAGNNETSREWSELNGLYTKKLWHQLTLRLTTFIRQPHFNEGRRLIELYENFIEEFEMRINPFALMEMGVLISEQYKTPEESLKFLESMEPKIKNCKPAVALCKIAEGKIKLNNLNDIPAAKTLLEEADEILRSVDGVTSVHGQFYLLQSQLFEKNGDIEQYFRTALKFLGCTDLKTMTEQERQKHAINLTRAALVAEGIYSFGELLAHPVLNSIRATKDKWLVQLLESFNSGRFQEFEKLRTLWSADELLRKNESNLLTKIRLLRLVEVTFQRPATQRQLAFGEIARELHLDDDEVELYVMKALSKGLIRGTIDEVDQKVHVTWVLPRVLNLQQIGNMVMRLQDWQTEVTQVGTMVEKNGADILLL